jgi:large subunit ribosomal protein L24
MQKVLRRSLLARNQALRKTRRDDKKELKRAVKEFHRDRIMRDKTLRGYVKAERSARREDWFLGPLAPQRDVGDQKGIYGTMDPMAMLQPKVPQRHRPEYLNFAVGDRVVVVRGRSKGRISDIKTIDEVALTVSLEGMNTVSAKPEPNLGMI